MESLLPEVFVSDGCQPAPLMLSPENKFVGFRVIDSFQKFDMPLGFVQSVQRLIDGGELGF